MRKFRKRSIRQQKRSTRLQKFSYDENMKGGIAVAALICLSLSVWQRADATDLIANRSDTFIFEAAKSEEFSDSEILAVSRFKSERAIAYLPFTARGIDVGLDEKTDKIITVSLSLYVKDLPLFTAAQIEEKKIEARKKDRLRHTEKPENPPAPSGEAREGGESGTLSGAISAPSPLAAAAIAEAAAMAEEGGTEHDEKKIIRISIFGIVDDPAFEPNSKAFRVSWDGKNDAPAPKHDPVDGRIDSVGVFKIGTLELDLGRNTYDDGDKIEFESRELTEFMNFVYGINSAQGLHSDIRSHLGKIENFAIILKQESGERGVIFYSADSYGEDYDKPEDGDEKKRPEETSGNSEITSSETGAKQAPQDGPEKGSPKDIADKDAKGDNEDKYFEELKKLPPEKLREELEKYIYSADNMRAYIEETGLTEENSLSFGHKSDMEEDKNFGEAASGGLKGNDERDMRPRITFEHLRVIESQRP